MDPHANYASRTKEAAVRRGTVAEATPEAAAWYGIRTPDDRITWLGATSFSARVAWDGFGVALPLLRRKLSRK